MNIFFHLPKTAGGTLANGIRENAGVTWLDLPAFDDLPASTSDRLWSGGHYAFGLHVVYKRVPRYITILRDPIERLISEFFYHHQHKEPDVYIPDDELIPAFIAVVERAAHLNYYSYMFSDYCFAKESIAAGRGSWNGDVVEARDLLLQRRDRRGFLTENVSFETVDIDHALPKALANVRLMSFIGLFDRLSDTTAYLRNELKLTISLETRVHETSWYPSLHDFPGSVQAMLLRKTEADRYFFDAARTQFHRLAA